jgi:hypothetical protein
VFICVYLWFVLHLRRGDGGFAHLFLFTRHPSLKSKSGDKSFTAKGTIVKSKAKPSAREERRQERIQDATLVLLTPYPVSTLGAVLGGLVLVLVLLSISWR